MGFRRHEYQHGLPFSSPGDLPDPGILLIHLKKKKKEEEWNDAIFRNVDGPGDYHTKWSKSEKEIHIP